MLASEERLVGGEAVQISAGDIVMASYDETEDGFVLAAGEPGRFGYFPVDHSYGSADGDLPVYFVPYDGDDRYVMVVVGPTIFYGLARLRDGIIEIRMVHGGGIAAEIAAAGRSLPDGVTIADDAITVPDGAALGTMLEYIAGGIVTTMPMLGWIGDGEAPARLVPDGDWYRPAG